MWNFCYFQCCGGWPPLDYTYSFRFVSERGNASSNWIGQNTTCAMQHKNDIEKNEFTDVSFETVCH